MARISHKQKAISALAVRVLLWLGSEVHMLWTISVMPHLVLVAPLLAVVLNLRTGREPAL